MASGNRKRHNCTHFNFGASCHRCAQGEALKKQSAGEKDATKKQKLLDEAARLLGPAKSKSQRRSAAKPTKVAYDELDAAT